MIIIDHRLTPPKDGLLPGRAHGLRPCPAAGAQEQRDRATHGV